MAFSPISLPTQQILETTYVSDMRLILNTNSELFKNKLETLVNNLMIDLDSNTIGIDASGGAVPVTKIKTKSLFIQGPDGKFAFSNGTASPLIEFSSISNNSIGLIKAGALQVSSAQGITTTSITANGAVAFNSSVSAAAGTTSQFSRLNVAQGLTTAATEVTCTLTAANANIQKAVVTLSKSTSPVLLLNLVCRLTTFTGADAALPTGIQGGIDIVLKNDPTNPISKGQQIKIMVKSLTGIVTSTVTYINWFTAAGATTGNPLIRFTSDASSSSPDATADFVFADQATPIIYATTNASRWVIALSNKLGASSVTFIGLDTNKSSLNAGTFTQNTTKQQARLGILDFTPNCIGNSDDSLGLGYSGRAMLNTSLDA